MIYLLVFTRFNIIPLTKCESVQLWRMSNLIGSHMWVENKSDFAQIQLRCEHSPCFISSEISTENPDKVALYDWSSPLFQPLFSSI